MNTNTATIRIENHNRKPTKVRPRLRCPFAGLLALGALMFSQIMPARADDGSHGQPPVAPILSRYTGLTYADWAIRWWQWVARTDTPSSPFLDPTANFAVGQSGPVWNLIAWGMAPGDVAQGTVQEGTALFFPCSTFNDFGPFGFSPDEVFQIIANPGGEIDGIAIDDFTSHAVVTPPFMLTFTADNFFGLPAGDYGPVIASGYFILLRPLSVGTHTIHFHYDLVNVPYAGHYEVSYHLTVVPARGG